MITARQGGPFADGRGRLRLYPVSRLRDHDIPRRFQSHNGSSALGATSTSQVREQAALLCDLAS